MTWERVNLTLAALLLIVCAWILLGRTDLTRPNIEFLPDMKYSPAYGAYAPNPNFANGQTLQPPVPGTIARGETPLHYAATPEDAKRAGEELAMPELKTKQDEAAAVRRGQEIYHMICISCHGPEGAGDGPVARRGFPPPPSLVTGNSATMRDGQLFHILTFGQKSMPGFAARLAPEDRWNVIRYVRGMQQKQSAPGGPAAQSAAPGAPKPAEDEAGAGKRDAGKGNTGERDADERANGDGAPPAAPQQQPGPAPAETTAPAETPSDDSAAAGKEEHPLQGEGRGSAGEE